MEGWGGADTRMDTHTRTRTTLDTELRFQFTEQQAARTGLRPIQHPPQGPSLTQGSGPQPEAKWKVLWVWGEDRAIVLGNQLTDDLGPGQGQPVSLEQHHRLWGSGLGNTLLHFFGNGLKCRRYKK